MHTIILQINYQDCLAIVRLARGPTNPINAQMVSELADVLEELKRNLSVKGLVLLGAEKKFFSIGFDIPQLYDLSPGEFSSFYKSFNRLCLDLYSFPKPTIAAVSGHAIAGGCILALCCDYRYMAEGRNLIGLNEVKLGVPVPYPADCILRDLVGSRYARKIVETGEFFTPVRAQAIGLVDRVLPLEGVLTEACSKACTVGSHPGDAYASIKASRVELIEAQIRARLEDKEADFMELWYSPTARPLLQEAMEKF